MMVSNQFSTMLLTYRRLFLLLLDVAIGGGGCIKLVVIADDRIIGIPVSGGGGVVGAGVGLVVPTASDERCQ